MKSTNCPGCGQKLDKAYKFCPECGAELKQEGRPAGRSAGLSRAGREYLLLAAVAVTTSVLFVLVHGLEPGIDRPHVHSGQSVVQGITPEMLDQLPEDYNALISMGNRFMDEGNFPVAAEIYKRALAVNDESPNVRTDYGACLHAMGMIDRAIEEFTAVAAKHPNHAISRFNLGIAFSSKQLPDSARYYFERYLEMDPDGKAAGTARQYIEQLGE